MKYTKEIIISALIVLLLVLNTCSNDVQNKMEGEKVQLKAQLKTVLDGVAVNESKRLIQRDSILIENKKKDLRIAELRRQNSFLTSKIEDVKRIGKVKKEKAKKYSFKEYEAYFSKQYNLPKDVTSTESSLTLTGNVPNLIVEDLVDNETMKAEIVSNNKIIENKDEEIQLLTEKLMSCDLDMASAQVTIDLQKSGLNLAQEINKKSEKEIKALKVKNTVKTVGIVVGVVVGVLIGGSL